MTFVTEISHHVASTPLELHCFQPPNHCSGNSTKKTEIHHGHFSETSELPSFTVSVRRRPEDCAQNGSKTPTFSSGLTIRGKMRQRTFSNGLTIGCKTRTFSSGLTIRGKISRHVRHGGPQVRCGKNPTVVHILRVARVARENVETRTALRGVARAELGRVGLEEGPCKSRLKAPKFEKWLNGAPPQAELNEAINALLQQLGEKRQQSGGEGP